MGDLANLLERVEKATGPDRELDCRLFVELVHATPVVARYVMDLEEASGGHECVWTASAAQWRVQPYTASLDAALALVERKLPGWLWMIVSDDAATMFKRTERGTMTSAISGVAKTPALALLAAMLKALIAQGSDTPTYADASPVSLSAAAERGPPAPSLGQGREEP